ncbi:L,D-transpeptidase family protein [Bradyrhizobium diazoefficiens]|uniref:L,D-transpeptidase family protein n=1 Tax=Bradyrhizobium diazoefficiens TaxID=1355477 RepID=UPI001B58922D|nr:L,D-peptidoglycan transpeptidase YkuD (ErfK/YbiS/YcfS/YnhG family) [Bradyrhizobium japonicum]
MAASIGRSGVVDPARKVEGDGYSPAGSWPLRQVFYRADRCELPNTELPVSAISPDDGWCDAPTDRAYNRLVKLPYEASAERLWRDDNLYDLIVVLGYNDAPVIQGKGSCIFWHIRQPDGLPTEGCVAIDLASLLTALSNAKVGDTLTIEMRTVDH